MNRKERKGRRGKEVKKGKTSNTIILGQNCRLFDIS
jgi:hypothetical protein